LAFLISYTQQSAGRRAVLSAAAMLLIMASIVLFRQDDCLVAEYQSSVLFAWPIRAGDTFEVTYLHSINFSPVTDVIEWTGRDLVVVKSVFRTFGAGIPIPTDITGAGAELLAVDGHYELIGIDKHMQGFYVMTQAVPDHRIIYGGREARLLDLISSGNPVRITVKRQPLLTRLLVS
jgi:hypothetical protein